MAAGKTATVDQARALRGASGCSRGAASQGPLARADRRLASLRTTPTMTAMRVSHETIYRALYVQAARRASTRADRAPAHRAARRRSRRAASSGVSGQRKIVRHGPDRRPAGGRSNDRAVPGHWEGDLLVGGPANQSPDRHPGRAGQAGSCCSPASAPTGPTAHVIEALKQQHPRRCPRTCVRLADLGSGHGARQPTRRFRVETGRRRLLLRSPARPGSGARTRTPTACCANTCPKGSDLAGVTARQTSTRSRQSSTAALARRSAFTPRPEGSPSSSTASSAISRSAYGLRSTALGLDGKDARTSGVVQLTGCRSPSGYSDSPAAPRGPGRPAERRLAVIPEPVVHPGPLEGWGCQPTQPKEETG